MYSLATPICTSSLRAAEDSRVLGFDPTHSETQNAMFTPSPQGAFASNLPPDAAPVAQAEPLRHMLLGSLGAVQATIKHLHKRGYADPNDWSQPLSTGRPNEVMAILTKRVTVS